MRSTGLPVNNAGLTLSRTMQADNSTNNVIISGGTQAWSRHRESHGPVRAVLILSFPDGIRKKEPRRHRRSQRLALIVIT